MLRLLEDDVVVRAEIAPVVGAATVVWWLNTVAVSIAPHVLVHAACVGARGAVLLPGASGAGKSTLAAACIGDGIVYLSDEYAALDRTTGRIDPYARPIELATRSRGRVVARRHGRHRIDGAGGHRVPAVRTGRAPLERASGTTGRRSWPSSRTRPTSGSCAATPCPGSRRSPSGVPPGEVTYGDDADAVALVRDLAAGRPTPSRRRP